MATVDQINAKVDEAIAANESGDYATALQKLTSARMLLAGTPDTSEGSTSLRWDRAGIDVLITQVTRAQTRATVARDGIKRTKNTYRRTSCE